MTREEEVFESVRDILVYRLTCNPEDIEMETNIYNDLGCDSLDATSIIIDIEQKFDIFIPETDPNFKLTVGSVVKSIEEKTCCA